MCVCVVVVGYVSEMSVKRTGQDQLPFDFVRPVLRDGVCVLSRALGVRNECGLTEPDQEWNECGLLGHKRNSAGRAREPKS